MQTSAMRTENTVFLDAEIAALVPVLRENDRIADAEWRQTLSDRKIKELQFHDANRDRELAKTQEASDTYEKFYGNKKYYDGIRRTRESIARWITENAPAKIFLDYACGDGMNAIAAAKAGAKLSIGIDISPISIENARRDAEAAGVADRCFFLQADCENTKLPNECVDLVMCSGMLHHLDLSYAFLELRRIMKTGGKLLAVEALDYNPAIKLYRMMTPSMRTEWEKAHILSLKDLRFASRFFDVRNTKYWHLLGILTPHVPAKMARMLERLDMMLEKIPLVQLMAWIFTFELIKRKEA